MLSKVMIALLMIGSCSAAPDPPKEPPMPPSYPWVNGPSKSPDFFPIAVWYQNPIARGGGRYATVADAAVAEHINIILGTAGSAGGGTPWPERFGDDDGELAAVKAHGIYLIGAIDTPYDAVAPAPASVASIRALIAKRHAESSFIGYNIGDEPLCDTTTMPAQRRMNMVPTAVAGIAAKDPTRPVFDNFTFWQMTPQWSQGCRPDQIAALKAVDIASFDLYSMTLPWFAATWSTSGSDFVSVPNDSLFLQGLAVQAMHEITPPGKPLWVFIESGSDNYGFSGALSFMQASIEAGSTTLKSEYSWTRFTRSWIGLTISGPGILPGTKIVAVTDLSHAVLSKAASADGKNIKINVTSTRAGDNGNCIAAVNLCVIQGNAMRPMPEEVNAEVWMSIIAGANGIEYFCQDSTDIQYCLGGNGSRGALATQTNLTRINATVLKFAPVLNAPTIGICALRRINPAERQPTSGQWTTRATCQNGNVTLTTSDLSVPGRVLVKHLAQSVYVLVQSDARSSKGAIFTIKLASLADKNAVVVYDSNEQYQPDAATLSSLHKLDNAGQFSDAIGAGNNSYQTRIYRID